MPYGAPGGAYEGESTLRLHPPRSPEAEARAWPIEIVARSRARGEDAGAAAATITLEPYNELESELRPEIASGRRGAEFAIAVRNVANAPIEIVVSALDEEGACRFDFDKPQLSAAPGRRDGTPFRVRPPKQMIFGRTKERRFSVTAQAVGSEVAARPQPAVFKQRPWIPAWVIPIVPLLIIAGVALWALRPNTTTVPDLTGSNLFAAQQKLDEAGLKLGDKQEQETAGSAPGTIINTIPAAGKEVDKGKEVTVLIAIGSGKVAVPTVVGLTFQAADGAPAQERAPGRPLRAEVRRPREGDRRPPDARPGRLAADGQPGRPRHRSGDHHDRDDGGGDDRHRHGVGGQHRHRDGRRDGRRHAARGPSVMPALAGLAAGAAINQLGSGVKATQEEVYSDTVEAGKVISSDPPEGTKLQPGQAAKLLVSRGPPPPIAFVAQRPDLHHDRRGQAPGPAPRARAGRATRSPPGTAPATCSHTSSATPTTRRASGSSTPPSRRPRGS